MKYLPLFINFLLYSFANVFDPFDDSIHFDLVWGDPKIDFSNNKETIVMKSSDSEEYVCQLPLAPPSNPATSMEPDVAARDIIGKLETDKVCSYRVDSYWIYEVCHGKHIKQFHEERDVNNKKVLVKQVYYLGYIGYDSHPRSEATSQEQIATLNHAGALRPFYTVSYSGGTDCDLRPGLKRKTVVIYMCMPDFQTSVISVKETSTCVYEVIIYTSLLCKNRLYKIQEDPINHIYCLSKDGTKWKRPIGYNKLADIKSNTFFDNLPSPKPTESVNAANHPKSLKNTPVLEPKKSQLTFPEKEFLRQFLYAEKCVVGGMGWWKYEFCYMKSLKQFHQEKGGKRIEILLGIWEEDVHIEHVKENNIQVSTVPKFTDLYYFAGNICDDTGLPRQVQVRLRCSNHSNVQALTMFMEEPSTCVYKFTAESVLFCKMLTNTDEFGIPRTTLDDIINDT